MVAEAICLQHCCDQAAETRNFFKPSVEDICQHSNFRSLLRLGKPLPTLFWGLVRDFGSGVPRDERHPSRAALSIEAGALSGDHQQDHRTDRGRNDPLGSALSGRTSSVHAGQCHHGQRLFWRQCPSGVGRAVRARLGHQRVSDLQISAGPQRQRLQRRTRHHGRLPRPLHTRKRQRCGGSAERGRSSAQRPVSQALYRIQCRAMRRASP